MPGVRLLVADDHEVARIRIRALLRNNPDWKVVAEASDGQQAIERAKEFRPDIAILDFNMPRTSGLEAAGEIVKNLPDTKVLLLTCRYHESGELILAKSRDHRWDIVPEIPSLLY